MARMHFWKRLLGQRKAARQPGLRGWRRPRLGSKAGLFLEHLEDRSLLSVTVLTPNTLGEHVLATDFSLRDAVIAANAALTTDPVQIHLAWGKTYTLSLANGAGQENAAATGDLDVTSAVHSLIIEGGGSSGPFTTVIDQAAVDRVFQLTGPGVKLILKDVVVMDGQAVDDGTALKLPGSTAAWGGGVLSQGGDVVLKNVLVLNDKALGADGGSVNNPSTTGRNAAGGGLYSSGGAVVLNSVTFLGDVAQGGKGADGAAVVGGAGGVGGNAQGGAMYNADTAVIAANLSAFANVAQGGAGGNGGTGAGFAGGAGGTGGDGLGGALYEAAGTGKLSLTFGNLSGNRALGGAGGSGGVATLPFFVGGAGGTGGNAQGGALWNATTAFDIALTSFLNDFAVGGAGGAGGGGGGGLGGNGGGGGGGGLGQGGALYNVGTGTVSLAGFHDNAAKGGDGGNGGNGGTGNGGAGGAGGNAEGGAIDIVGPTASLTLKFSTVIDNKAIRGAGGAGGSGAIFGAIGANGVGTDGGVHTAGGGTLTKIFSAIFGNFAI